MSLNIILAVTSMAKAIEEAQDVLARYILPEGGPKAEDALGELLSILDNKDLVSIMRTGEIPESIRVQSKTLLKHNPPPVGAAIEVSGAWFRMAQNIARWCAEGHQDAELATVYGGFGARPDGSERVNPQMFDQGPTERGERSDGGRSDRC